MPEGGWNEIFERREKERERERKRETCRWNIKYRMHASYDHADITDYVMAHLSWNHDSTLVFELHESWPSSEIWIPRSVRNEASLGIVRFLSRHFDLGQIFGANSWRWFYNSRRVARFKRKRVRLQPVSSFLARAFLPSLHDSSKSLRPEESKRPKTKIGFETRRLEERNCSIHDECTDEFRQNFLRIFLAEEEFACTRAKFRDAWFVWPDRLYLQWQTKYFIAKQI